MGAPCLSCQLASITFQNPLASRMETLINAWLPMDSDTDSNDCDASTYKNATDERNVRQKNSAEHMINSQPQHLMSNFRGLVQQRQASINASIESIKAEMSATGNRKIFTELTAQRKSISALHSQDTSVDHKNISKGQTTTYINTQDKNIMEISPRHHASVHQPRPPLAPIDTNAINDGGIFGRKDHQ